MTINYVKTFEMKNSKKCWYITFHWHKDYFDFVKNNYDKYHPMVDEVASFKLIKRSGKRSSRSISRHNYIFFDLPKKQKTLIRNLFEYYYDCKLGPSFRQFIFRL